jgi:hypothetical protein
MKKRSKTLRLNRETLHRVDPDRNSVYAAYKPPETVTLLPSDANCETNRDCTLSCAPSESCDSVWRC